MSSISSNSTDLVAALAATTTENAEHVSLPVGAETASTALNSDAIRMTALFQWISGIASHQLISETLRPASADASFRRYFRIDAVDGKSYIIMDAPQPAEDVRPFIAIAKLFAKAQLLVPEVLAEDTEQGFYCLPI